MLAFRQLRRLCAPTSKLMDGLVSSSIVVSEAHSLQQEVGVTGSVYNVGAATNIKFHDGMVPRADKEKMLGQKGVVIWFTGKIMSPGVKISFPSFSVCSSLSPCFRY